MSYTGFHKILFYCEYILRTDKCVDYDSESIQAISVSGKILDFFRFSHSTSNARNSVNIGPLSLKIAPEIGIDLLFLDFDLDL